MMAAHQVRSWLMASRQAVESKHVSGLEVLKDSNQKGERGITFRVR